MHMGIELTDTQLLTGMAVFIILRFPIGPPFIVTLNGF